ncbi:MAG: hypothetical protein JEZ00_21885 [Anaerolineaceae bacterium]|nr:hypothetical protein [Anaerolineaceae bacterium]
MNIWKKIKQLLGDALEKNNADSLDQVQAYPMKQEEPDLKSKPPISTANSGPLLQSSSVPPTSQGVSEVVSKITRSSGTDE